MADLLMNQSMRNYCVVLADLDIFLKIKSEIKTQYSIHRAINVDDAYFFVSKFFVSWIIAFVDINIEKSPRRLAYLRTRFPMVPIVAVLGDHDLEVVRICGEVGIAHVILISELSKLTDVLKKKIFMNNTDILLNEYRIDINQCSTLIKTALKIFEEQYLELMGVHEVSDFLGISQSILSKEFKKYCPIGPKRLLLLLKLNHAFGLMKNPGLIFKDIANMVGIADVRRLNECFHRILGISPSECRKNYIDCDFYELLTIYGKNKEK